MHAQRWSKVMHFLIINIVEIVDQIRNTQADHSMKVRNPVRAIYFSVFITLERTPKREARM